MDNREELRRLIDLIEKGSGNASLEQAVDDLKTFANTASYLANSLEARLKTKEVTPKGTRKVAGPKAPRLPPPVQPRQSTQSKSPSPSPSPSSTANALSTGISQADYDRLKPIAPQRPISAK